MNTAETVTAIICANIVFVICFAAWVGRRR